jgi:dipeptidyl-peptidase-4
VVKLVFLHFITSYHRIFLRLEDQLSGMKKYCWLLSLSLVFITGICFSQKKNLDIDDVWTRTELIPVQVPGFRSMNDGAHYSNTVSAGEITSILRYNFSDGKVKDTILDGSRIIYKNKVVAFSDYSFNNDETMILLSSEVEKIYRHSSKAFFFIYNRKTGTTMPVSIKGKQMYATISPDNKRVAFVRENNLYITDLITGEESAVTKDGKKNEIINGAVDWVYEEEFTMDTGYRWNADGSAIAYYKFDESNVKEFNLTFYGDLYPEEKKYKYPKAGEENSKVDVYIYNLKSAVTIKAETGEKEYLPRIKWTTDPATLSIQRMNRLQNKLELLLCNAPTGTCKAVVTDESKSYVDVTDDLTFLKNGKQFIWSSAKSGYNHIYLYNMDGSLVKQVTSGNFDVISYYGYDEKSKSFYYQSAEPTPMERRVNRIDMNGKITVLSPASGTSKASFSSSFTYFANTWSSYGNPYICTLRDGNGKEIRTLEDNKRSRAALAGFNISAVETLSVQTRDGVTLNGWMIRPPDFDPSGKYPVLFYIYGGIGKQTVVNAWGNYDFLWHEMMAEKGYIIVSFDNRGTPGRGVEFATANYKNMGHIETLDQLDMVEYIKKQPYVDAGRIGVWGWSFGGYMTSLLMTKGNGVFKCGVAVAPVTNWKYYDSVYTERFLQLPKDNNSGYEDNSPINFAKDLQGKLLIVHGSTDDNVHMQNTMDFVTALVNAKKPFDMFIYPNKSHSITGNITRRHLYDKITSYISENL